MGMAAAAPPPAIPPAPAVPAPRVPGPAGFFIGLDPPEVTEERPAEDEPTQEPVVDGRTQVEPVQDEPSVDRLTQDESEPELTRVGRG